MIISSDKITSKAGAKMLLFFSLFLTTVYAWPAGIYMLAGNGLRPANVNQFYNPNHFPSTEVNVPPTFSDTFGQVAVSVIGSTGSAVPQRTIRERFKIQTLCLFMKCGKAFV